MSEKIAIEVAYAKPDEQRLLTVLVDEGSTAEDAVALSGVLDDVDDSERENLRLGVWGRVIEPAYRLRAGDRVEIYRPLEIDPREARRKLAEAGRTMRQGPGRDDGA